MKKWLLLSLSFSSFFILPKEEITHTYEIQTNVEGMKYGLYEDEECKTPLLDENDQEIIIEMDDQESQSIMIQQDKAYIKQIDTVDGYYLDPEVYTLEEKTTLPSYPITIKYISDIYPITYHLFEEDKEVHSWTADKETIPDITYIAGKTYQLQEEVDDPYVKTNTLSFTIPKEYDLKYEGTVEVQHQSFGIIDLNIYDEKPLSNVTYTLYQDPETKEAIKDIDGNECVGTSDEEGKIQFQVQEGTYYLKQTNISEDYYNNPSITEVNVRSKETTEVKMIEHPVEVLFLMKDIKTNEIIDSTLWINELNKTVHSNEKIALKRNTEYSLKDVEHPNGYYTLDDFTYTTSETYQDEVVELSYQPFVMTFQVVDQDTNKTVNGSQYGIYDESGQVVLSFQMNGQYQTSALHDGVKYTWKEIGQVEGYLPMKEKSFEVTSDDQSLFIQSYKIPYTTIYVDIKDTSGKSIDGVVGIFQDKACTKQVKDIDGNLINDSNKKNIRNGTYFMKLIELDKHYVWNDEVKEIKIDHSNNHFGYTVEHVGMDVKVQTVKGNELNDVELELLDESGTVLTKFFNQSIQDAYSLLERDKTYGIRISHINGLYTYEKSIKSFVLTKDQLITFECDPYINVSLQEGGTYGLFKDVRCLELGEDIYGNQTKKSGDTISWLMREGTYYLKQLEVKDGYYPNQEVQEIHLKEGTWSNVLHQESTRITLDIQIKDEDQELVGEYELLDEDGNVKDRITQSNSSYNADWLKAGSSITIHEVKAPAGYKNISTDITYSIPKTCPEGVPSIVMEYEKEISPVKTSKIQNDVVEEIEKDSSFPSWTIGCGIILCGILIGYLVYRYRK